MSRWDRLLALVAFAGIVALLSVGPVNWLDKADRAASAVCHRIPTHSLVIAGRQLPLCARCSGTYLGALAGLTMLTLRGRGRAARLPGVRTWCIFALFLLAWAADGVNSFLTLIPGAPYLYEPSNLLRLVTGMLEGLVIAATLLPVLNQTLWTHPATQRSVTGWRDLVWMLAGGAVLIGLVASEWQPLLFPLALLSGLMVLLLVGLVNTMVILILLHRDGQARVWREVITPLLLGVAAALLELTAIAMARSAIAEQIGLPF